MDHFGFIVKTKIAIQPKIPQFTTMILISEQNIIDPYEGTSS